MFLRTEARRQLHALVRRWPPPGDQSDNLPLLTDEVSAPSRVQEMKFIGRLCCRLWGTSSVENRLYVIEPELRHAVELGIPGVPRDFQRIAMDQLAKSRDTRADRRVNLGPVAKEPVPAKPRFPTDAIGEL